MQLANLKSYNMLDAIKPEQKVGKLEEGNDSLDNFIRQAIRKEPVLSFSRAGDTPVQWIQLLHALDQQDLPGWPLLSPPKVPMQKCDKCAREFCSPINYRRHIRVHRRSLNIDKDFPKNRNFLGEFWDKLSLDEAKEVVSFKDIALEEVPGSSIIKALTSVIRKPGFSSLPPIYVKAGSALLDVVQARPSRFPISSQEFFNILDEASEKTFLCAGTAVSMQKFVFDGEAGKIGLEMRNIVACTSFLVEQKLVKAWFDAKDAEALRCQKLLVEEEEAAQKRQADLLERRRLKKLRQKEQQKAKEQIDREEADFGEGFPDPLEGAPSSAGTSSPLAASSSHSYTLEEPADPAERFLEPALHLNTNEEVDTSDSGPDVVRNDPSSSSPDSTNFQNVDHRMQQGNGRQHQMIARHPLPSSQRVASNGFHLGQPLPKLGPVQRQGIHRDQKASIANGHKIWTRKTKPDKEEEDSNARVSGQSRDLSGRVLVEGGDLNARILVDSRDPPDLNANREVLIGSICVTLRDGNGQCQSAIPTAPVDHRVADNHSPQDRNAQEKSLKPDPGQIGINRSKVKLWRPVGRHEAGSTAPVQDENKGAESDTVSIQVTDRSLMNEICLPCLCTDDTSDRMDSSTMLEDADPRGLKLFCSSSAEAFLTQRWKEAIAADHLRLVLSPVTEPLNCREHQDDTRVVAPNILCSTENLLSSVGPLEPATHGATKLKIKAKADKGGRLKYIPKQRNLT